MIPHIALLGKILVVAVTVFIRTILREHEDPDLSAAEADLKAWKRQRKLKKIEKQRKLKKSETLFEDEPL